MSEYEVMSQKINDGAYKSNEAKFKPDLLKAYGLTGHPKADTLYWLAWSYGHSAGLSEVLHHFNEMADLLK